MRTTSARLSSRLVITFACAVSLCAAACGQPKPPAPAQDASAQAAPSAAPTSALAADASPQAAGDAPAPPTAQAASDPKAADPKAAPPPKAPKLPNDLMQPLTQGHLRTTSCKIHLHNLRATIKQHEQALAASPADPLPHLTALAAALYAHGRFLDDPALLRRVIDLATDGLTRAPNDPALLFHRLRARASLHLFADARADLAALSALPPADTADLDLPGLRDDLDLNTTLRPDPALRQRVKDKPVTAPSFASYTAAAFLYAEEGDTLTAHRYFALAERRYTDTTPIPLAWLNVQRGLLDLHTGNFTRARTFYRAALDRCPTYPMAVEHLAEVEALLGAHAEATRLYDEVIAQTQNPEFLSALADLYDDTGHPDKAQPLRQRARARFDNLYAAFPSAMSWHAADFYLSQPDTLSKALALLTQNARSRPTPDAFHALAVALLTCHRLDDAAAALAKATSGPVQKPEYDWAAAQLAAARGLPDDAAQRAAAARARNPQIDALEGPPDPPPPPASPCDLPPDLPALLAP